MILKSVFTKDLFRAILVTTLIEGGILAILQPFDINNMKSGKWVLIIGCCVLNVLSIILSQMVTVSLCKLPFLARNKDFWSDVLLNVLNIAFLPLMICLYNSYVFHDSIAWGWYDKKGDFSLDYWFFHIYCVSVIAIFAIIFSRVFRWNTELKQRLKEAMALNDLLVKRMKESHVEKVCVKEEVVKIEGTTKDNVLLNPKELLFVESNGNYVVVNYINGEVTKKESVRCTMKQIEDYFVGYPFVVRCHRAYIVNLSQVIHFEGNSKGFVLSLNGTGQKIPVARAYTQNVRKLVEAE